MSQGPEQTKKLVKSALRMVRLSLVLLVVATSLAVLDMNTDFFSGDTSVENTIAEANEETLDPERIEDGIHVRTGLIHAEGMGVVIGNCTGCHSAKLITQNRMTAERWNETIKWMQETQNLWDLGDNQEIIVNYLVKNYPPAKSGTRRSNLSEIEWYEQ